MRGSAQLGRSFAKGVRDEIKAGGGRSGPSAGLGVTVADLPTASAWRRRSFASAAAAGWIILTVRG